VRASWATLLLISAVSADGWTNPLAPVSADPWVVRDGDSYLYTYTTGRNIVLARAASLAELGRAPVRVVWTPPAAGPCSRNLWAPEIHRLDGRWYLYFAADDGVDANHRMWVLAAESDDPFGAWRLVGKLATPDDHWAIDGTVAEWRGQRWFVWSGWAGRQWGPQHLYLAAMASPTALAGERIAIASPTLAWERHGAPVNEGPTALVRDGVLHLLYSASVYFVEQYCVGLLTLRGADPRDPAAWAKQPQPVFAASAEVKGPGHASVTTSPDGRQWYLVYHAHHGPRRGNWVPRDLRAQPFAWGEDGLPRFGAPVATVP